MKRGTILAWSAGCGFAAVLAIMIWSRTGHQQPSGSTTSNATDLVIYSTTDSEIFAPVIRDFRALNPAIGIDYHELDAATLFTRYVEESDAGKPRADLLLSSAMDLQVKLANDGYAAVHLSPAAQALPDWARWRDEAFSVSFEPVAMVFSRKLMEGRHIPKTRAELLRDLSADPSFWHGRVGTYDISKSSTGYLLATQDDRLNSEFTNLVHSMADAKVSVGASTRALLDRVARGELAVGYNVLGSYAYRLDGPGSSVIVVYTQDYTLALSRTAVIPKDAPNQGAAHLFLDYLLSARGQKLLTSGNGLYSMRAFAKAAESGFPDPHVDVRPIALGPGLLVYLDPQKRKHILERLAPLAASTAGSRNEP